MSQIRPLTAQDFTEAAAHFTQAANQMTPGDRDHYGHAMSLIVYHLRAAATKAREVAEQLASSGPTNAGRLHPNAEPDEQWTADPRNPPKGGSGPRIPKSADSNTEP